MRCRRTADPPCDLAAGELLAWEADCATAAAAGNARAADRLVSARSWTGMLRAAGGDPEVAELLAAFAADDRAQLGVPR
jgi:hypothetical protein